MKRKIISFIVAVLAFVWTLLELESAKEHALPGLYWVRYVVAVLVAVIAYHIAQGGLGYLFGPHLYYEQTSQTTWVALSKKNLTAFLKNQKNIFSPYVLFAWRSWYDDDDDVDQINRAFEEFYDRKNNQPIKVE